MNNDSPEYMNQANNIIDHGSFYAGNWGHLPHNPALYSLRPPLYALMVLFTVTLTSNPFIIYSISVKHIYMDHVAESYHEIHT
jgi:hypothetical protein